MTTPIRVLKRFCCGRLNGSRKLGWRISSMVNRFLPHALHRPKPGKCMLKQAKYGRHFRKQTIISTKCQLRQKNGSEHATVTAYKDGDNPAQAGPSQNAGGRSKSIQLNGRIYRKHNAVSGQAQELDLIKIISTKYTLWHLTQRQQLLRRRLAATLRPAYVNIIMMNSVSLTVSA